MHNLPAQCLELEVTEGILISDIARAQRVLRELKAIDVGLDLDDFGTGYSSLKYLQSFPFASLKVDRSFVAELGTQAEATTIAHSIVTLGRALKLDVIAEGVETPEQAEMLLSMGCEYGQGYLYSKPLPPEEMRTLLAGRLARHGSIRLPRIEADALTSSAA
jgi:EAL domain-containing protein (putative c-di-GMP-specific phosphodiesterase class I)